MTPDLLNQTDKVDFVALVQCQRSILLICQHTHSGATVQRHIYRIIIFSITRHFLFIYQCHYEWIYVLHHHL